MRRAVDAQWRHQLSRPALVVIESLFGALLLLGLVTRSGVNVAIVGVLVALVLTTYARSRIRSARVMPAGSQLSVAVGEDRLHTDGPLGTSAVRLGVYGRVIVRRHLVLLEHRATKRVVPYARRLFPDAVLDDLRERVRVAAPVGTELPQESPTGDAGDAPPGEVATFVTDAGYIRRLARTYLHEVTLAPARLAKVALVIIVGAVGMAAVLGSTGSRRPSSPSPSAASWCCCWSGWCGGSRSGIVRNLTRQVPVGSVFRAALRSESLSIEGPAVTGETRFSALRSVSVRGEFVFLQVRETRVRSILPVQLFPGGSLDLLRERVDAAAAAASTRRAHAPSSTR